MGMTDHPITPPPELVGEWSTEAGKLNLRTPSNLVHVANRAAQWGADQELEACCELMDYWGLASFQPSSVSSGYDLRAARRPKQPTLKEQALIVLDDADLDAAHENILRRALEALPND